jgi:hypothetical protein
MSDEDHVRSARHDSTRNDSVRNVSGGRGGRGVRSGGESPAERALREIEASRARRSERDRARADRAGPAAGPAADVNSSPWGALRRTFGVAALGEYDQVMAAARVQLDSFGYVAPQPVSWRWGTLVVEAGAVDAVRLRLDASRLCAAIVDALPGCDGAAVARLEVRVVS